MAAPPEETDRRCRRALMEAWVGRETGAFRLLIDHARIGHTFYRPTNDEMQRRLARSSEQHDEFIDIIGARNEDAAVDLVFRHWELCRTDMTLYVTPREIETDLPAGTPRGLSWKTDPRIEMGDA